MGAGRHIQRESTAPRSAPFDAVTWSTHRAEAPAPSPWPRGSSQSWHSLTRLDAILAIALFAGALLARWPLIQRGDTLLHFDEAIVGLMAQDIAASERLPIYFYGQRYMGALEAYVIAGLSLVISDPIVALRLGPALFFAALVAVQYLMLTRWFGRRGGLLGAALLICGPPMFAQWSISARGGYIEILLWGTLLLWSYVEWFVAAGQRSSLPGSRHELAAGAIGRSDPHTTPPSNRHRLLFGLLLGSGLWINPSIVLFVAPIPLHAALARWPAALSRWTRPLGRAALPVLAIAGVLLMNCVWASWVEEEAPRSLLLLGILPRQVGLAGLGLATLLAGYLLARRKTPIARLRTVITGHAPLILGILLGAAPAAMYAAQAALGLRELEPALPLGLRPLWKTGETMFYLFRGLPILFGADPRPFVDLVTVGRARSTAGLSDLDGCLIDGLDWLIFGALCSAALVFAVTNRHELGRLLRLVPGVYSPATLLAVGSAGTVAMYLLGGCSFSFTTIRYLLPIWAFVPGLLAFVFTRSRPWLAARLVPLCLCGAWAIGQFMLTTQLGAPHPLRDVARAIEREGIHSATAEILDAHLLSYLTRQSCRVQEYEPFWPRLSHYRCSTATCSTAACSTAAPGCVPLVRESFLAPTRRGNPFPPFHPPARDRCGTAALGCVPLVRESNPAPAPPPTDYIVNTHDFDRTRDWTDAGWPGPPPPETQRTLWPAIHRALIRDSSLLLSRKPLAGGYELIRLRHALPRASHRS